MKRPGSERKFRPGLFSLEPFFFDGARSSLEHGAVGIDGAGGIFRCGYRYLGIFVLSKLAVIEEAGR